MRRLVAIVVAIGAASCGTGSETGSDRSPLDEEEQRLLARLGPIGAPPPDPTNRHADDPGARKLGQALFYEFRMSGDGTISCGSCHDPAHGFADPRPLSLGVAEREGERHASTLTNVAFNRFQFWDGRVDSLWAQPLQAIENPVEGDFTRAELAHLIDAYYRASYEAVFGPLPDLSDIPDRARPGDAAWEALDEEQQDKVNRVAANVGKALAAYMRQLISRNSRLDRYLAGEKDALSEQELRGAKIFVSQERGRCILCHDGPNLTDDSFHNLGIPDDTGDTGRYDGVAQLLADPFNGDGPYSDDPGGRLAGIAQLPAQLGQFKTPTLRDVTLRPPYGHTGAFETLEAFIDFHDRGGGDPASDDYVGEKEGTLQPIGLTAQEKEDLIAFLHALEGEPLAAELLAPPR